MTRMALATVRLGGHGDRVRRRGGEPPAPDADLDLTGAGSPAPPPRHRRGHGDLPPVGVLALVAAALAQLAWIVLLVWLLVGAVV